VTEKIMKNLIAYFIQKQHIVPLAMLDLNPRILTMGGESIFNISIEPYIHKHLAWQQTIGDPLLLQYGVWKKTWDYRLHGIGCKLTHRETKEPLQWDSPNPNAFRFDWFYEHLLWRKDYDMDDPYIVASMRLIQETKEVDLESMLIDTGIIILNVDGSYLLMA
jgi:hypothetical protein